MPPPKRRRSVRGLRTGCAYTYTHIRVNVYIYIYIYIYIYTGGRCERAGKGQMGHTGPGEALNGGALGPRQGTDGVSTNGVTANFMLLTEGLLGY